MCLNKDSEVHNDPVLYIMIWLMPGKNLKLIISTSRPNKDFCLNLNEDFDNFPQYCINDVSQRTAYLS